MSIANTIKTSHPDAVLLVATQYNPYTRLPEQCQNPAYVDFLNQIKGAFEMPLRFRYGNS